MNDLTTGEVASVSAVVLVMVATLAIGAYGWRFSRTTSDFFVASRSVGPTLNASAVAGEYLSGASFLGVAGLVLVLGADMLWYPVGFTAGYLVMLVLVAAPLRRSGAYTLPDFAETRLESLTVRRLSSALVVATGCLYLLPQFLGAGLALRIVVDAPTWVGGVVVAAVVLVNVLLGGMRSVTFVQAFQYWLKLTALLVPALFLLSLWWGDGATSPAAVEVAGTTGAAWSDPVAPGGAQGLYTTYSIIAATFLGTMGLPHVVVRFYTNPDGWAARRTTVAVLALLGLFYALPPVYAALGRLYAPDLVARGAGESVVLELPRRVVGGTAGDLLAALTAGGAFAAFLATSSGLAIAVAGVLSQDVLGRGRLGGRLGGVRSFQVATAAAVTVPLLLSLVVEGIGVAQSVGLAFAFAASTFCPLMVLGIWWRGLTAAGAAAGLGVGGLACGAAVVATILDPARPGWTGTLVSYPAAWSVAAATVTMVGLSLLTRHRTPTHVATTMVRLHTPESLPLNRGAVRRRLPG